MTWKMNNKLCENLTLLMEHNRIGAVQLARLTGIPLSTIKNIRKGSNINPTIETLIPLARHFDISLEDLIEGHSSLLNKSSFVHGAQAAHSPKRIPIISWEAARNFSQTISSFQYVFTERKLCENAFALTLDKENIGVFAAPGLIIINPILQPEHLDYVLVSKKTVERPFIKQFICDEEFNFLKSLNIVNKLDKYDENYQMIGIVVEYRQFIHLDNKKTQTKLFEKSLTDESITEVNF